MIGNTVFLGVTRILSSPSGGIHGRVGYRFLTRCFLTRFFQQNLFSSEENKKTPGPEVSQIFCPLKHANLKPKKHSLTKKIAKSISLSRKKGKNVHSMQT